jgi:UDP-N-acetylglucosamine 2-epimerase (non-hydrolysing)
VPASTPSLHKPVLVLRDNTERPEGVDAGTLKVVGTSLDNVYKETKQLLEDQQAYQCMCNAKNPYGFTISVWIFSITHALIGLLIF